MEMEMHARIHSICLHPKPVFLFGSQSRRNSVSINDMESKYCRLIFVNAVISLPGSIKAGNFWISGATFSYTRRILPYGTS
jgi:hypothetical protein